MTADVDFYPQEIRFLSRIGADIVGRGTLASRDAGEYRLDALEIAFSRSLESKRRRAYIWLAVLPSSALMNG